MIAFSIIIPLYNKASTIRTTIESVLNQRYPHFELLVVDDGSTDRCEDIVKSIQDERVRLFSKDNGGPGSARNLGIRNAQSDWCILLDADDLMMDNALLEFASVIESNPSADMVVGNFELLESGKTQSFHHKPLAPDVHQAFKSWFLKELMPCAGTYCCKTELLKQFPFQENIRRSEDTEVLFHLFRTAHIIRTNAIVMRYRRDYSIESRKRTTIGQDFQGHLNFDKEKSLWERICLYELYVEAKNNYPDEVDTIYPDMTHQWGLRVAYYFAFWYRAFRKRFGK